MKKNILISTGGSGGHVVPATVFCEHLKKAFEEKKLPDSLENSKYFNIKKMQEIKLK